MSVKEFAKITEQIGQAENTGELYRRQGITGENMQAMAEGMAIARRDSSRLRGKVREAEDDNLTLTLQNHELRGINKQLQEEQQQLNAVVVRARNLLAEMTLRNAAFKRTIDHLKEAWGPEKASEIEKINQQKDADVRNDPEFGQKVSDYVMEKTQPPGRQKTTVKPR